MTSAHSPQAKPWKTAAYLIKLQVPDYRWQLLFCRRLRVPTPRHDSLAAIDPVETVTPPMQGSTGPTGSCCYFYSTPIPVLTPPDYCFSRSMLSYSWRIMAARISAGVLPSLVC